MAEILIDLSWIIIEFALGPAWATIQGSGIGLEDANVCGMEFLNQIQGYFYTPANRWEISPAGRATKRRGARLVWKHQRTASHFKCDLESLIPINFYEKRWFDCKSHRLWFWLEVIAVKFILMTLILTWNQFPRDDFDWIKIMISIDCDLIPT